METTENWARLVNEKLKAMLWASEYKELLESLKAKTCDEHEDNRLNSLVFTLLMETPEESYQTLVLEMEKGEVKRKVEVSLVEKAICYLDSDELNTLMCAMIENYEEAPELRKHLLRLLEEHGFGI